ncbi:hypothetical protein HK099_006382 [Clydaea vesicula]|uniref:Protein HGH1 homolog n=1 Tax=Clydaea vesicula TaxID=447962 RepID=A0AAD5TYZ1_9FUNG|nr:hypothetical protein HK099_006382 [Clydaea vesicula]KAJ3393214.1 hypothetical protein HDU92_007909 [Lobulomyces angularis]
MDEILTYLDNDREEVRLLAAENIASLSASPEMLDFFKKDNFAAVQNLMQLINDEVMVAHQILNSLINLTAHIEICEVMNIDSFIYELILKIVLPKCLLSDPCCMLLNNLTKSPAIISKLLPNSENKENIGETQAPSKLGYRHLDNLLEIFCKGDGINGTKKYNPHANYHFLSGVFANISATPGGAEFLLGKSTVDDSQRLSRLIVFTTHKDKIRRSGVISVIKNTSFLIEKELKLFKPVEDGGINLLGHILIPLAGTEEYDDEITEKFLPELQYYEGTRESDAVLRQFLVEALLIMCSTLEGRELLRDKGVYYILQKLHLWEKSESVQEVIEKTVDLLQRDEDICQITEKVKISKIVEVVDSDDEEEEEINKLI